MVNFRRPPTLRRSFEFVSKRRNLNGGFDGLNIDSRMSFLPSGPQHLCGNTPGDFFDLLPRERSFNWHRRAGAFASCRDVSCKQGRAIEEPIEKSWSNAGPIDFAYTECVRRYFGPDRIKVGKRQTVTAHPGRTPLLIIDALVAPILYAPIIAASAANISGACDSACTACIALCKRSE
jgi:hypothetical protein